MRPGTVYVCEELFSPAGRAGSQDIGHQSDLLSRLRDDRVEVVHLSRQVFEKAPTARDRTGCSRSSTGSARPRRPRVDGPDHLTLLSQGVEKPGNLGAMLRTADAAGVDAVVAADPVTDWGNPNVVRASKGTVFALPVASATTAEALDWIAAHDVRLVVTTPETDLLHTDVDYTGRSPSRSAARSTAPTATLHAADPPRPDPDARQGEQPQRRRVGCHRALRGGPSA